MDDIKNRLGQEINDLKRELEDFQKEKDRVRAIVGKIGGIPTFNTRFYNIIFAFIVIASLIVSLITGGTVRLIMIELAIAALSFKLIYLIHNQSRVNHFQLWILSSLEWRLNEIIKELKINKK